MRQHIPKSPPHTTPTPAPTRPTRPPHARYPRSSPRFPSVGRQGWQSAPLGWAEEFGAGKLSVGVEGFGACGVQGCGVDELMEVVYWMCGVVFPVGLSYLGMSEVSHSWG
jgi:hypothetical protein